MWCESQNSQRLNWQEIWCEATTCSSQKSEWTQPPSWKPYETSRYPFSSKWCFMVNGGRWLSKPSAFLGIRLVITNKAPSSLGCQMWAPEKSIYGCYRCIWSCPIDEDMSTWSSRTGTFGISSFPHWELDTFQTTEVTWSHSNPSFLPLLWLFCHHFLKELAPFPLRWMPPNVRRPLVARGEPWRSSGAGCCVALVWI